MSKVYIGTSGFSYSDWKERFYPEDLPESKRLEYFTSKFKTVEINSSFYHLPQKSTFEGWRKRTPEGFLFAIKVSRYISHRKYLKECREPWQNFYERAKLLKEKLGPFLVQLPPKWTENLGRVEKFMKIIRDISPKHRFAFEFRDKSWFQKKVVDFFKKEKNIILCEADSNKWPHVGEITGDFVYIRLHGPKKLYASSYPEKELERWTDKIQKYLKRGLDVYCYFNNDFKGYAINNAESLAKILENKNG